MQRTRSSPPAATRRTPAATTTTASGRAAPAARPSGSAASFWRAGCCASSPRAWMRPRGRRRHQKPVDPAEAAAAVEHLRKRAYGPSGGLDHDAWRRGSGKCACRKAATRRAAQSLHKPVFNGRRRRARKRTCRPSTRRASTHSCTNVKSKGPWIITQCQAHEKAVPFHQRALQKIDIKKTADAPSYSASFTPIKRITRRTRGWPPKRGCRAATAP